MTDLTILVRERPTPSERKRLETGERMPPSRILSRDRPLPEFVAAQLAGTLVWLVMSWFFTASGARDRLAALERT
jgi:hypothetical protein